MDKVTTIKNILVDLFPIEKLKKELWEYLIEMEFVQTNGIFEVSSYIVEKDEIFKIKIGEDEELNILTLISYYDLIDVYFDVVVVIGEFIQNKDSRDSYKTKKGLARMKFNYDLSLYGIEFFVHKNNLIREKSNILTY